MNYMKTIVLLFLLFTTPFLMSQERIDGIAAIVGNEIILVSEIHTLVMQYGIQNKLDVTKNPKLYQQLSREFMQRLIDNKLMLIKADEDTIKAEADQVQQSLDQQINYMIQQAGGQEQLEGYLNQPLVKIKNDMRKEIENQLRIELLRQKKFGMVNVSRREVELFYKEYQDSLPQLGASVDISHILLQVEPSEESLQKAYEKIVEIKQHLSKGEDFAEVARKYSEDPGTAARGGDLGFVERGDLVKEFEEEAFSLEEGEISDIVRTQFGFHVIQLLERRGEKIHVRHVLVQLQPTQEDANRTIQRLSEIREKIRSGEATFEEMAMKYSDDPNVSKDKGHLGQYRLGAFQIKEFENVVNNLEPGEVSEPFKTDFGYHIVRLNKRQDARQMSLETDWQQIEQWAMEKKREEAYQKWLAELRQEIPIDIKIQI